MWFMDKSHSEEISAAKLLVTQTKALIASIKRGMGRDKFMLEKQRRKLDQQ
jgi:hypothetical protein